MILDSSAICAIVMKEPEGESMVAAVAQASTVRMSAPTFVEAAMVIDAKGRAVLTRAFDDVLLTLRVVVEPLTAAQARIAREALRDFGRGSGHRARLNLGDCFAYALAKDTGEPLLFTGDDFGHTDVQSALPTG